MSFADSAAWLGPLPAGNYRQGRAGNSVGGIVLHTMVGSVASASARFHDPSSQVSAHYGVGLDGRLYQWVSEQDAAYHAGDYLWNLRSIGIEHEDGGQPMAPRSDALYATSAQLVKDLCGRYSIPLDYSYTRVVRHWQTAATACPDALDTDRIIREALAPPPAPRRPQVTYEYWDLAPGQTLARGPYNFAGQKVIRVAVLNDSPTAFPGPDGTMVVTFVRDDFATAGAAALDGHNLRIAADGIAGAQPPDSWLGRNLYVRLVNTGTVPLHGRSGEEELV